MIATSTTHFDRQYQTHLKHLKLKGLQPKTIEAYSRAIRLIGKRFDHQIDSLTEPQLTNYFTELLATHSWSTVKLDLYERSRARDCGRVGQYAAEHHQAGCANAGACGHACLELLTLTHFFH